MIVNRIKSSASELVEFFRTESPYRQASKGWLAEDVYLNLKPSKENSPSGLDQIAEVSFYWQPVIQIVVMLLSLITLATLLAFSPLYLFK